MDASGRFERDLKEAMNASLQNKSARLVLFWMFERCGVYQRTGNDSGVYVAKGKREVADEIMGLMNSIKSSSYWRFMAEMKELIDSDYAEDFDSPSV